MYADTDELVALCRVVAELGGYYAPHHRSYGAGALAAYAEMIMIARRSGCALHLTHATLNFDVNAGRAGELLTMIDDGRGRRARHHPRHLPVPGRVDVPGGSAAALGDRRGART